MVARCTTLGFFGAAYSSSMCAKTDSGDFVLPWEHGVLVFSFALVAHLRWSMGRPILGLLRPCCCTNGRPLRLRTFATWTSRLRLLTARGVGGQTPHSRRMKIRSSVG